MQVKEVDINTGKIKGNGICQKKRYKISLLGGPTTPTYSSVSVSFKNILECLNQYLDEGKRNIH